MPCNASFATSLVLWECLSRPSSFPEVETAFWKEQDQKYYMALCVHPQSGRVKGNTTVQLLLTWDRAINGRAYSANLQSDSFPSPFAKYSNWRKDFQNYTGRSPKFCWSTASDSDIKLFVIQRFIFFWNCLMGKHYKIKLQYYHKLQIKLFSLIASISSVCLDLCV